MAEICHLENRHYAIFSVEGGQIWIKCRRLVQNDMSTTVMWSKSKPGVEFQYDGRLGEFNGMSLQSHVSHCKVLPRGKFTVMIPEPHATLQGAVTWRNQCHDLPTLQGVRIPFPYIKFVFAIFYIFCFYCNLGFDKQRLSYRLWYTCLQLICFRASTQQQQNCNTTKLTYNFTKGLYKNVSIKYQAHDINVGIFLNDIKVTHIRQIWLCLARSIQWNCSDWRYHTQSRLRNIPHCHVVSRCIRAVWNVFHLKHLLLVTMDEINMMVNVNHL